MITIRTSILECIQIDTAYEENQIYNNAKKQRKEIH